MTLPPLAITSDVEAMFGRALTTAETAYATRLIAIGSALVRRYTRQDISQTLADVITLHGNWDRTLIVPQWPVTNVVSVVVNNVTWTSSQFKWNRLGDLTVFSGSWMPDYRSGSFAGEGSSLIGPAGSSSPGPNPTGPTWQGPSADVVVTYDHGFVTNPDEIANIIAGMVATQMATSPGIIREDIGGYRVFYSKTSDSGGGLLLTDEDKKTLNFYRRRTMSASIIGAV
jgi:hypothetical protein